MASITSPAPSSFTRRAGGHLRPVDPPIAVRSRRRSRVLARRRALVVFLLCATALALGWVAGTTSGQPDRDRVRSVAPRFYEVRAGDTLWDVARRLHTSGDLRATVDRLAASHGSGPLRVGERIRV